MSIWARLESIGDNCELGFVQRTNGVDQGSILKWARIHSPVNLLNFLTCRREEFYKLENLVPRWDDMLEDESSGVLFHTELYSSLHNGIRQFNGTLEDIESKYVKEYAKKIYMYDKFFSELINGNRIYVFKMNDDYDMIACEKISEQLRKFNSNNILFYVTDKFQKKADSVVQYSENIFVGYISRFAPYHESTDARLDSWALLADQLSSLVPLSGD